MLQKTDEYEPLLLFLPCIEEGLVKEICIGFQHC